MATPSPDLVAAWRAYKAAARARWRDAFAPVRRTAPHAEPERYYPEDPWGHCARDFAASRARQRRQGPAPAWETSEELAVAHTSWHKYGKLRTYRWTQGEYRYIVQVVPDFDEGIPDYEGHLSEKEPDYPYSRQPWAAWRRCETHGWLLVPGSRTKCPREGCEKTFDKSLRQRVLRGPACRFYWETGGYDRGQGQKKSREYQYGHISDYNYEDLREEYWLRGMSRHEADVLARQQFEHRRKRLEDYAEGNRWTVGVVAYIYRADAECDHCPLEEMSVWGIESDYDKAYIEETVRAQADEALAMHEQRRPSPTSSPTP